VLSYASLEWVLIALLVNQPLARLRYRQVRGLLRRRLARARELRRARALRRVQALEPRLDVAVLSVRPGASFVLNYLLLCFL
jgi:hypothetical protein